VGEQRDRLGLRLQRLGRLREEADDRQLRGRLRQPVVFANFYNPSFTHTVATVQCPIGPLGIRLKPFGGGARDDGDLTDLRKNINSLLPVKLGNMWRVDYNNGSPEDSFINVYAVCGQRGGWEVDAGAPVTNPAGSQTFAGVSCSAGKTSVGGGAFSNSAITSVNLNTTGPESSSSWGSYENNASGSDATVQPYAVCLK
jgi:hypothetical protein